jgi:hypothetical protein
VFFFIIVIFVIVRGKKSPENCIIKGFIIGALRQILLWWSKMDSEGNMQRKDEKFIHNFSGEDRKRKVYTEVGR